MNDFTDKQIETAFELLGITRNEVMRARSNPAILESLKARTRRNWRTIAKALHPDRTGNDPQSTALYKCVKHIVDELAQMELRVNPRRIKWALRLVQVEAT